MCRETKEATEQKKPPLFSLEYLFYDFVKLTASIPGLLIFRPKRIYENEAAKAHLRGGNLVIANHDSYMDPICLMLAIWYRRFHFVCTEDFYKKWTKPLFVGFRCIPIERNDFSLNVMRRITDRLKTGRLVALFPSGHVSTRETRAANQDKFKPGVIMMAMQGRCPIVPIYIHPPERLVAERLTVVIGERIDLLKLYGERLNLQQIREAGELLWQKEEELKKIYEEVQK